MSEVSLKDYEGNKIKSGFKEPTKLQKEAGNYKKYHINLHSLNISIENIKGSYRSGTDKQGKEWKSKLPAHYGYIKNTKGSDNDNVDCYIGEIPDSELIFIVNQLDDNGLFDEHKVILGCISEKQAKDLYVAGFSDKRGLERLGSIHALTLVKFKTWLNSSFTRQKYNE